MHQTDSAVTLAYNLFKELRLSRDLFGDKMHFTCQLSLQNNSTLFKQSKIWSELMNAKTDRKKLEFKYLDSETEERCTIFPVYAMKLQRGNRGIAPHILQIKSGRKWIFSLTPRSLSFRRNGFQRPFKWRLYWSPSRSGRFGERKNPSLLPSVEIYSLIVQAIA
jgi:hypothetical protein